MLSNKKLSWRAFTSLYMVISFVIMVITGLILYIAPPGRIANWTELTILGLTKGQWQALHTNFTFLFIIAGGFHIYFNWKPIVYYFRTRMAQTVKIRKETVLSVIAALMVFGLILANVPPFSSVMEIGEGFKDSWADTESEPPVPHAEEMTLQEFAKVTQTPLAVIITNLEYNGIKPVKETDVISDLAGRYNLSPQQIFKKISTHTNSQSAGFSQDSGFGRKTLSEVCENLQVPVDYALDRLARQNIKADPDLKLKDIADKNNIKPIELVAIIKGEKE